ncbi:glycosyltransferase [Candidatus Woesearchaeota archaeon]|nr:glycosyltransferase [Candidatus Woesearchaeota archaeon]
MKVLVGCPTYDGKLYCLEKYADGLKALTYPEKDILLVDNSSSPFFAEHLKQRGIPVIHYGYDLATPRDRIIHCRNLLRKKVIAGYDYFLSLEADVVPPPSVIEHLLAHKKDIVSAVVWYYADHDGKRVPAPLLWDIDPQGDENYMVYIAKDELAKPQLKEIKACSLSCCLMTREVLEKVVFRYKGESYDDVMFCLDARQKGYRVYVDTRVECTHYYKKRKEKN